VTDDDAQPREEDAQPSDPASDPSSDPPRDPSSDASSDTDAIFEALWTRVVEAWDDDKPHQAILQHALDKQMLPELAGRYRKLKDDAEKGPRAQKKIDGIVIAATSMLMSMKTPARTKTPWQWTASAALLAAIVTAWLYYRLFVHHG
jgi:hypothetical protein